MFEFRRFRRDEGVSIVEKIARKAGLAALLCIVAAEGLAAITRNGELPRLTLVWSESDAQRLAKAAPSPQSSRSVTTYRNIGIDGVTTSTIPRTFKDRGAFSPCGE